MLVLETDPPLFFWMYTSLHRLGEEVTEVLPQGMLKSTSELVVDSADLSAFLGYTQNSIRKQILERWGVTKESNDDKSTFLVRGVDYHETIYDAVTCRRYETDYAKAVGKPKPPVPASRGYLFVTVSGIAKIATRTTKKEGMRKLLQKLYNHPQESTAADLEAKIPVETVSTPDTAKVEETTPSEENANMSQQKMSYTKYKVLQTLLEQLKELSDPSLRELAIRSAEMYTGMDLGYLRNSATPVTASSPEPEPLPQSRAHAEKAPEGPITKPGYYSLTLIGAYAGEYSGRSAGAAANIVAKRMGYTPQQIRSTQLPFNQLATFTDTRGKEHAIVRFNQNFSNRIIHELLTNSAFHPSPAKTISSFSGGSRERQYPKLSEPVDLNFHADDFSLDDLVDELRK